MSSVLDAILLQAADQYPATVTLSPEDVTVLLYAMSYLDRRSSWLNEREFPLDEITTEEWDQIEALVANANRAVMMPQLGMIFPIISAVPPDNCLLCDGGIYARADYPSLYAILDPAFVVDADNFTVPDLRHKTIVGVDETAGSEYEVNAEAGLDEITLSSGEMPSHQHGLFQTTALAVAPGELPVVIPAIAALGSTDLAGSGGAHENRMPYRALNYAVVAL